VADLATLFSAEKEAEKIFIVVASLVAHCCAIKKNVIVAS